MNLPTPNNYVKIGLAAMALLMALFSGLYVGHLQLVAYEEKVATDGKVQEQRNKDLLKERDLANEKVRSEYKNELARIKSYYGGLHYASGSQLSGSVPTLVRIDGYTADPVFAEKCASTTLQLVKLQQEIKDQPHD
jgi:hypothetical protein